MGLAIRAAACNGLSVSNVGYRMAGLNHVSEMRKQESMSLILKGGEFIATEALSESVLLGLMGLARNRTVLLNGLELRAQDLARLAEEAQRTGRPVWPQASNGARVC